MEPPRRQGGQPGPSLPADVEWPVTDRLLPAGGGGMFGGAEEPHEALVDVSHLVPWRTGDDYGFGI